MFSGKVDLVTVIKMDAVFNLQRKGGPGHGDKNGRCLYLQWKVDWMKLLKMDIFTLSIGHFTLPIEFCEIIENYQTSTHH